MCHIEETDDIIDVVFKINFLTEQRVFFQENQICYRLRNTKSSKHFKEGF